MKPERKLKQLLGQIGGWLLMPFALMLGVCVLLLALVTGTIGAISRNMPPKARRR